MATKEKNAANAEMMAQHIASYKESGLRALEYCKNNDLSIHRFNYWFYRRKEKRSHKAKSFTRVMTLDKLSAPVSLSRQPTVEVTLANGNRIAFFEANSLDLFKALL